MKYIKIIPFWTLFFLAIPVFALFFHDAKPGTQEALNSVSVICFYYGALIAVKLFEIIANACLGVRNIWRAL